MLLFWGVGLEVHAQIVVGEFYMWRCGEMRGSCRVWPGGVGGEGWGQPCPGERSHAGCVTMERAGADVLNCVSCPSPVKQA